jgi:hypothetical protein
VLFCVNINFRIVLGAAGARGQGASQRQRQAVDAGRYAF